ncbi:CLUMA_CG019483, isoform A [Clunio marinus]|uniref:CLUMA_CG019483, isoform A n=1 Tax=Clunio marinus TaxID=568069 RepID=A0A1J1J4U7_9DIPT|nr:CLUMA_CG019483, isoform A [Clunio marinus]
MAPTMGLNNNNNNGNGQSGGDSPLSKTYQYRKIMKPMLERKRRARINRCLDELKELITGALQNSDGEENITKLEKADILELTVRHFHNLKRQNKFYVKSDQSYADRFRDGFSQCAKEVTKFLYSQQNRAGEHIIVHLNDCMRRLDGLTNTPNNMQINNNNNNNYISNDNLHLELNHQQSASFVSLHQAPSHHHQHPHNPNNTIRQPIPLLRKSPIPPQHYLLPLPSTSPQAPNGGSPIMLRTISRESMSSTSSNDQNKDDSKCCWRPW